jgi:hypothetical protein
LDVQSGRIGHQADEYLVEHGFKRLKYTPLRMILNRLKSKNLNPPSSHIPALTRIPLSVRLILLRNLPGAYGTFP